MRKAVSNPQYRFDDLQQALKYIEKNLTIPMRFYHRKSPILNRRILDDFLSR